MDVSADTDAGADGGGLAWRALSPFGVEVEVDLAAPLTAAQQAALPALLWEHGLVIARGQKLSAERQREICALFGPVLLRAGESGYLDNDTGHDASSAALAWHADAAYTEAPFDAIALHAVDVVDGASSTRFVSAEAALERLPEAVRHRLAGARVELGSPRLDSLGGRICDADEPVLLKRGEQPGVFTNPHNGRSCVWVSELQAVRVLDMAREEGRALLHAVFDELYAEASVFEHVWHQGDFVIWDNIALQHARGSLKACGRRVLQRAIVGTSGVIPTLPEP